MFERSKLHIFVHGRKKVSRKKVVRVSVHFIVVCLKKQHSQTKLNKIVIRISPSHTRSLKKLRATVFPFLSGRRTRRAYSKLRAPDNVNVGEHGRGVGVRAVRI